MGSSSPRDVRLGHRKTRSGLSLQWDALRLMIVDIVTGFGSLLSLSFFPLFSISQTLKRASDIVALLIIITSSASSTSTDLAALLVLKGVISHDHDSVLTT
uniref:Uncharacterized protein n=1 Tax=Oryza nivara TaxID=4536 RepID=A0A0E0HGV0_ORYNI